MLYIQKAVKLSVILYIFVKKNGESVFKDRGYRFLTKRKTMKKDISNLGNQLNEQLLSFYKHLHRYPELSFEEKETAAFVTRILTREGIPFQDHIGGYGILARIEGKNPTSRIIGLRADMDALPIHEETGLSYQSCHEGVMHACGHDAHTACLLGCALLLNRLRQKLTGTVLLIFQPAEERHPGGARLMLQDGVFDSYRPELIIGQHVNAEVPCGSLAMGEGCIMASADEFHLVIRGKGGHGAMPYKLNDTVLAAAQTVVSLQQLVSRRHNPFIPAVITVGKFMAEGATNIIPDHVNLSGTLRCMDEKERKRLQQLIRETVQLTAQSYGCQCDIDMKDGYPSVVNDPTITQKARIFAGELWGEEAILPIEKRMTAEDFGFFSATVPSTFYRLGIKSEATRQFGDQHTATFGIDERALKIGMETLSYLAVRFLEEP